MADPKEKTDQQIFIPLSTDTTLSQQYERVKSEDQETGAEERIVRLRQNEILLDDEDEEV